MANTPEGGKRTAATLKKKDPDFYKKIGALGGKAKVPKGTAMMTPERLLEVSRKAGIASGVARKKK